MSDSEFNVYVQVGGDPLFRQLVDDFYARIEADPLLRPMFPDDLEAGKEWQFLFLTQFFGGPARYQSERGHPRLRMRHSPFPIDQAARDHWLEHMLAAMDAVGITEPSHSLMKDYFMRASTAMMNAEPNAGNLMHWNLPREDRS